MPERVTPLIRHERTIWGREIPDDRTSGGGTLVPSGLVQRRRAGARAGPARRGARAHRVGTSVRGLLRRPPGIAQALVEPGVPPGQGCFETVAPDDRFELAR